MRLQGLLVAAAQARPEAVLLRQGRASFSYGEAEAGSDRVARLLASTGVGRGDRVGLLVPNSPRYVAAYFGILKAGAIAVPLHTGQVARSLAGALADCGAVALVVAEGAPLVSARKAASEVPSLRVVLVGGNDASGFPPGITVVTEDDVAAQPAARPQVGGRKRIPR